MPALRLLGSQSDQELRIGQPTPLTASPPRKNLSGPPCGKRSHGTGKKVTLCYGSRDKSHRADLSDFEDIPNLNIRIATDDGSEGHHGFVTDLVSQELSESSPDGVYCCGPEPMMHAVAKVCSDAGVPCWLSLETPMACGFGACFSCVTKVKTEDGEWDYRRTCVEGPVFPAETLCLG